MGHIETDYLVVGAGASGMAFSDTLLEQTDADITLVDRRHRPGGHWLDAYPFVRLHLPSRWYGVPSLPLEPEGVDLRDDRARATGTEICAYFLRVLEERFLPSGRVRFLPMTEYRGGEAGFYELTAHPGGQSTIVRVRKRLVDARLTDASIPSRHTPSFEVDDGVRFLSPNALVDVDDGGSGFTVLGAGKTSMDTCHWLLECGVAPELIRWIRPRDGWLFDRDGFWPDREETAPVDALAMVLDMQARMLEAAAEARDTRDLMHRYEAKGVFQRLDSTVEPEFFRGATASRSELEALRRITNIVRLGKVRRIGLHTIELTDGELTTDPDQIYIDCTAAGVAPKERSPIFGPGTISLHPTAFGNAPLSGSVIAYVEATRRDDAEKNRLCPVLGLAGDIDGWTADTLRLQHIGAARMAEPDLAAWLDGLRLNLASGVMARVEEPGIQAAMARLFAATERATDNLEQIVAA